MLVELLALEVRRPSGLLVDAYYVDPERRVLRRLRDAASLYATEGKR